MSKEQQRNKLREAFQHITLTLGGIFYAFEADDELVWAITHALERIFEEKLLPIPNDAVHKPKPRLRPHPAVVELLAMIDRIQSSCGDKPSLPHGNGRTS